MRKKNHINQLDINRLSYNHDKGSGLPRAGDGQAPLRVHLSLLSTKKKFSWKFSIDSNMHHLEMISSTLSGKKTVLLDMKEIHSEKKYIESKHSLLNIDFDFSVNFKGHVFRISRVTELINKFELRIDNQDFQ